MAIGRRTDSGGGTATGSSFNNPNYRAPVNKAPNSFAKNPTTASSFNTPAPAPAPAAIRRPAPAPAPAPTPSSNMGAADAGLSTPYSGSGEPASAMLGDPGAAAADEQNYLDGDFSYQTQLAALMKAITDARSDNVAQKTRYETDYNDSLKGLGYKQDNPATMDINEGGWDQEDQLTASGRAFQNQKNDFASRGLLQSSLFRDANTDLGRGFNDQLKGVTDGRTNFMDDLARSLSGAEDENTLANTQARTEALYRRSGQIAL